MDIEQDLQRFIQDELAAGNHEGTIEPDEDLFERGILDSAGIAQLISFIEERYSIAISDEELVPENFQSIAAIGGFVGAKLGARI
jgi:acyl carrier protein